MTSSTDVGFVRSYFSHNELKVLVGVGEGVPVGVGVGAGVTVGVGVGVGVAVGMGDVEGFGVAGDEGLQCGCVHCVLCISVMEEGVLCLSRMVGLWVIPSPSVSVPSNRHRTPPV